MEVHKLSDLPAVETFVQANVDHLLHRCIQGSPEILPLLVRRILATRADIIADVRKVAGEGENGASMVIAALERESVLAVQERIKIIAQRKCYGLDKKCNVFEDQDLSSARIWELHDAQFSSTYDKYCTSP